jgi:hypothetical protein
MFEKLLKAAYILMDIYLPLGERLINPVLKRRQASNRMCDAHIRCLAGSYLRNCERITKFVKFCCLAARKTVFLDPSIKGKAFNWLIPPHWRKRMSNRRLLQLSMLGRAMPNLNSITASREALEKHAKDMCSGSKKMDPRIRIVSMPADKYQLMDKSFHYHLTGGSCYETRLKDGGYTARLQQIRAEDGPLGRVDMDQHLSKAKTLIIKELGNKYRVVTPCDAVTVLNSHSERLRLKPRLYRSRAIGTPLLERPLVFKLSIDDNSKRFLFSADLSAATDTLSWDCIDKLSRYWEFDPRLVKSFTYESTIHGQVKPNTGTFMGLPLSWTVLSLTHEMICRVVDSSGESYFIKGDDLIAYWTIAQWLLYKELSASCGFVINDKKTMVSLTEGIFCEKFYRLGRPTKIKGWRKVAIALYPEEITPLRFVSSVGTVRTEDGFNPNWVTKGKSLEDLHGKVGKLKIKALIRILSENIPKYIRTITPDRRLPLAFGGLSMCSNLSEPIPNSLIGLYRYIHNGGALPAPNPMILESPLTEGVRDLVLWRRIGLHGHFFRVANSGEELYDVSESIETACQAVIRERIILGYSPIIKMELCPLRMLKTMRFSKKRIYYNLKGYHTKLVWGDFYSLADRIGLFVKYSRSRAKRDVQDLELRNNPVVDFDSTRARRLRSSTPFKLDLNNRGRVLLPTDKSSDLLKAVGRIGTPYRDAGHDPEPYPGAFSNKGLRRLAFMRNLMSSNFDVNQDNLVIGNDGFLLSDEDSMSIDDI